MSATNLRGVIILFLNPGEECSSSAEAVVRRILSKAFRLMRGAEIDGQNKASEIRP